MNLGRRMIEAHEHRYGPEQARLFRNTREWEIRQHDMVFGCKLARGGQSRDPGYDNQRAIRTGKHRPQCQNGTFVDLAVLLEF